MGLGYQWDVARVGPRMHVLDGVHWSHLANITEPSMCGGFAAFCQITFEFEAIIL